ncbi:hypothetical protein ADUPG1_002074, partial [Aduncisulcus paluster]
MEIEKRLREKEEKIKQFVQKTNALERAKQRKRRKEREERRKMAVLSHIYMSSPGIISHPGIPRPSNPSNHASSTLPSSQPYFTPSSAHCYPAPALTQLSAYV